MYKDSKSYLFYVRNITIILLFKKIFRLLLKSLDSLYMLIYNIGETGVVQALTNSVPLTLYLVENYDVARKGVEKCLKIRNFFE